MCAIKSGMNKRMSEFLTTQTDKWIDKGLHYSFIGVNYDPVVGSLSDLAF